MRKRFLLSLVIVLLFSCGHEPVTQASTPLSRLQNVLVKDYGFLSVATIQLGEEGGQLEFFCHQEGRNCAVAMIRKNGKIGVNLALTFFKGYPIERAEKIWKDAFKALQLTEEEKRRYCAPKTSI